MIGEVWERYHAVNSQRNDLIRAFLDYRRDLRRVGFKDGFQWLGGSFVEDTEMLRGSPPRDMDIVVFLRSANMIGGPDTYGEDVLRLLSNEYLYETYRLDAYFVDLDGEGRDTVRHSAYWTQIFGHQRHTSIWKGILQVDQDTEVADDLVRSMAYEDVEGA